MSEVPVVDASPLIHLSRAGFLNLLGVLSKPVRVPTAVAEEVRAKGEGDPTASALASTPWLQIVQDVEEPPELGAWELGRGERAVLAWARTQPNALAVLDDREARRCAHALGLPVIGTLGIVVRARRHRLIQHAKPVIEQLVTHGMYLREELIEQVLLTIGE